MTPAMLALLGLFVPLAVALFLVLAGPLRRLGKPAAYLSLVGTLFSLGTSIMLATQLEAGKVLAHSVVRWLPHVNAIELGIHLDGISVAMLVVVGIVASCVQIFSLGYMADEPANDFGRYFTWHSLFVFAMNSLVLAPNLLQLFLGWELVGLVSYLLIGFYYTKPSAARAAVKAFWVTKFADMGLLLGLIVLFVETGSFGWDVVVPSAGLVTMLLFFAVMGKSAQFPLHVWLPDAMEGPTPVSALLHAATMVAAGVFLVVRAFPLFEQAPDTLSFMTNIGAFTALFAAIIAVVQTDIKKVLAYSTCSQLGYMVCALGAGSQVAGYFHLTTHAFFKALLFLAAGSLIHGVHSNDMRKMGGLLGKMKITSVTFIIGAFALAGVPGLAGFFSKDLVLEVVYHKGLYLQFGALMFAAFLTAFYMGRVIFLALLGKPSQEAEHAHESGLSMTLPLVVLATLAIVVGYFGTPLAATYGQEYHFHVSPVGIGATLLGLSGLLTSYWMFGKPQGGKALRGLFAPIGELAKTGLVDRFFVYGFKQLMLPIAAGVAFFDRYVVDGLMNFTGYATMEVGDRLRTLQSGNVQHYVYAVAVGMMALGAYGVFGGM